MLYLFLGPDDYSKKQHIDTLVKEKGADLVVLNDSQDIQVSKLTETDLFSKPKVFVLNISPFPGEGKAVRGSEEPGSRGGGVSLSDKLIVSKNHIVITVPSLDKRKKENKELLANKSIIVKEFALPHGKDLDRWIVSRVSQLGAKISADAVNELAVRLGRDEAKETKFGGKVVSVEEVYSLWTAENEIKKLLAYAGQEEINRKHVIDLVSENGEVDVLQITNALADKNKELTFELINKFLKEQTASDQKGGIIQLNALLSEQFRNVALVQDFLARKIPEGDILEKTGWKSGRLFVMSKISDRFDRPKVMDFLNKLSALDEELKTSQTPPRTLLDLILVQMF